MFQLVLPRALASEHQQRVDTVTRRAWQLSTAPADRGRERTRWRLGAHRVRTAHHPAAGHERLGHVGA